jgi:hypothetical protein
MVLSQVAYFAALVLWVPLAIVATVQPSVRRRVMVPLVASAIAAAYESYMSLVWSTTVSNPIRVDIFLVMFALGAVDGIAGFSLVRRARGRPDRASLQLAGILCLGVPALAIAAFATMRQDLVQLDRNLDLARRFRFEAYFRDDETQKRVFGALEPLENTWAGYYLGLGDDDRFAHLVINDEGRFWIYSSALYVRTGTGRPVPGGFEGIGDGRMDARMRMALRGQDGGPFLLEVRDGLIPGSATSSPAPMRKANPPRFPRPPSANDEVRFAGVFSATFGETPDAFWLTQIWLWESGDEWWGQYLRDHFTRGSTREFVATEAIDPACSEQCKVLSFQTSRGPVILTRVSEDQLTAVMESQYKRVTLTRGETLPGFFLDLAPLATKMENHQWLEAITTAGMITWQVPLRR